jgi:hypothetical protein
MNVTSDRPALLAGKRRREGGLTRVAAVSEGDFGRARRVTRAFNGRPQRGRVSDLLNSRMPSRKRGGNDSDGRDTAIKPFVHLLKVN